MAGEVCAACSAAGSDLLQCSRCRAVSYCGPACQRRHWRAHKAQCSVVWRVEAVPGKGLGLVAARDIQPGQVILTEKPLLLLRKDKTDNKVESKTKIVQTSLSIYIDIAGKTAVGSVQQAE